MAKNKHCSVCGLVAGLAFAGLAYWFVTDKDAVKKLENTLDNILGNNKIKIKKAKTKLTKVRRTIRTRKISPSKKATRKTVSKAVTYKIPNRALKLLDAMDVSKGYTQKELSEMSGIPYRSVRRYIDVLHASGLVYTKGKARAFRIYKTRAK